MLVPNTREARHEPTTRAALGQNIEDEHGSYDWTAPDDELFAFITDLVRPVGTHLYGRRMYDTMPFGRPTPPWPPSRTHGRLHQRLHLFIRPVLVGGGKPALPSDLAPS